MTTVGKDKDQYNQQQQHQQQLHHHRRSPSVPPPLLGDVRSATSDGGGVTTAVGAAASSTYTTTTTTTLSPSSSSSYYSSSSYSSSSFSYSGARSPYNNDEQEQHRRDEDGVLVDLRTTTTTENNIRSNNDLFNNVVDGGSKSSLIHPPPSQNYRHGAAPSPFLLPPLSPTTRRRRRRRQRRRRQKRREQEDQAEEALRNNNNRKNMKGDNSNGGGRGTGGVYSSSTNLDNKIRVLVCSGNLGNEQPDQASLDAWIPRDGMMALPSSSTRKGDSRPTHHDESTPRYPVRRYREPGHKKRRRRRTHKHHQTLQQQSWDDDDDEDDDDAEGREEEEDNKDEDEEEGDEAAQRPHVEENNSNGRLRRKIRPLKKRRSLKKQQQQQQRQRAIMKAHPLAYKDDLAAATAVPKEEAVAVADTITTTRSSEADAIMDYSSSSFEGKPRAGRSLHSDDDNSDDKDSARRAEGVLKDQPQQFDIIVIGMQEATFEPAKQSTPAAAATPAPPPPQDAIPSSTRKMQPEVLQDLTRGIANESPFRSGPSTVIASSEDDDLRETTATLTTTTSHSDDVPPPPPPHSLHDINPNDDDEDALMAMMAPPPPFIMTTSDEEDDNADDDNTTNTNTTSNTNTTLTKVTPRTMSRKKAAKKKVKAVVRTASSRVINVTSNAISVTNNASSKVINVTNTASSKVLHATNKIVVKPISSSMKKTVTTLHSLTANHDHSAAAAAAGGGYNHDDDDDDDDDDYFAVQDNNDTLDGVVVINDPSIAGDDASTTTTTTTHSAVVASRLGLPTAVGSGGRRRHSSRNRIAGMAAAAAAATAAVAIKGVGSSNNNQSEVDTSMSRSTTGGAGGGGGSNSTNRLPLHKWWSESVGGTAILRAQLQSQLPSYKHVVSYQRGEMRLEIFALIKNNNRQQQQQQQRRQQQQQRVAPAGDGVRDDDDDDHTQRLRQPQQPAPPIPSPPRPPTSPSKLGRKSRSLMLPPEEYGDGKVPQSPLPERSRSFPNTMGVPASPFPPSRSKTTLGSTGLGSGFSLASLSSSNLSQMSISASSSTTPLGPGSYARTGGGGVVEATVDALAMASTAPSTNLETVEVLNVAAQNTGFGGLANKGGIAAVLLINGSTVMSFVTVHLEAHEGHAKYVARCNSIGDILNGTAYTPSGLGNREDGDSGNASSGAATLDRHHDVGTSSHYSFVLGDLNFRTQHANRPYIDDCIANEDWRALNDVDELHRALSGRECLYRYRTLMCNFPPTFKVERTSGYKYVNKRKPSYTDRILYRTGHQLGRGIRPLSYEPIDSFATSDHKPVRGAFVVTLNDTYRMRPVLIRQQRKRTSPAFRMNQHLSTLLSTQSASNNNTELVPVGKSTSGSRLAINGSRLGIGKVRSEGASPRPVVKTMSSPEQQQRFGRDSNGRRYSIRFPNQPTSAPLHRFRLHLFISKIRCVITPPSNSNSSSTARSDSGNASVHDFSSSSPLHRNVQAPNPYLCLVSFPEVAIRGASSNAPRRWKKNIQSVLKTPSRLFNPYNNCKSGDGSPRRNEEIYTYSDETYRQRMTSKGWPRSSTRRQTLQPVWDDGHENEEIHTHIRTHRPDGSSVDLSGAMLHLTLMDDRSAKSTVGHQDDALIGTYTFNLVNLLRECRPPSSALSSAAEKQSKPRKRSGTGIDEQRRPEQPRRVSLKSKLTSSVSSTKLSSPAGEPPPNKRPEKRGGMLSIFRRSGSGEISNSDGDAVSSSRPADDGDVRHLSISDADDVGADVDAPQVPPPARGVDIDGPLVRNGMVTGHIRCNIEIWWMDDATARLLHAMESSTSSSAPASTASVSGRGMGFGASAISLSSSPRPYAVDHDDDDDHLVREIVASTSPRGGTRMMRMRLMNMGKNAAKKKRSFSLGGERSLVTKSW